MMTTSQNQNIKTIDSCTLKQLMANLLMKLPYNQRLK